MASIEAELLALMFQGQAASFGANLFVALHTALPAEDGPQTASELAYTGYARVAVPRVLGSWLITEITNGAKATPVADIVFPQPAGGSFPVQVTHFSVGLAESGAGSILLAGAIPGGLTLSDVDDYPVIKAGTI